MNPFLPGLMPSGETEPPLMWRHGSRRLLTVARGQNVNGVRVIVQALDDRIVMMADATHEAVLEQTPDNLMEFKICPQLPPGLYRIHVATAGQTRTRSLEVLGHGWRDICPAATLGEYPFDPDDPFLETGPVELFP